ncbi:epithelial membrane protein 2-like [Sceloporus undulatus]|uniref:epithelial membrane protein 2-like n=1 Tax=Sceloporus undulatus TaxID=8520 RepID=UPI001C4A9BE6|nr:epithelial membrane protein 2-like [Sceloporus undulatus]
MHALQICAVVFSFVSLLLLLISLGSDYWQTTTDIHSGLWTACIWGKCGTLSNPSDTLNAVRAFMLIGMIAGAVSFFGLCATFCKSKLGSISLAMISASASIAAGICVMIAMAIFTANASLYGWSFGLGWASFPLYLITGSEQTF